MLVSLKELCVIIVCTGWSPDFGGMTSYIAKDEDEEVLCNVSMFPQTTVTVSYVPKWRLLRTSKWRPSIGFVCTHDGVLSI